MGFVKSLIVVCAMTLGISASNSNAATIVVVDPGNPNGWTFIDGVDWSHSFVTGPAVPPGGVGSLNFKESVNDGSDAAQAARSDFDGMLLSTITELSYSTYVTTWNGQQAPWIRIFVDLDNNGTSDDGLAFEPDYQYQSVNDLSPAATTGVWQTWNTLTGNGWYSASFAAPGDVATGNLADYIAANPGARFATDLGPAGSFRIRSGFTGPGDNFDVNIDNVNINGTIYDFEPVAAAVPLPASAWGGIALITVLGGSRLRKRLRERAQEQLA